jgi:hypothetical protein
MHLSLFRSQIATGLTLAQLTQVAEPIIPASANGFLVQPLNKVAMACLVGTGAVRAQLQSASLRKNPYIDIAPVNRGLLAESPVRFTDWRLAPLVLAQNEELDAFAAQNAGTNQSPCLGVWFCDGPIPEITRQSHLTIHATASATLNAAGYTSVSFTMDQSLDPGTYAIIGARCFSATGIFFRFIPNMGASVYRPGAPMVQAYDGADMAGSRHGGWGEWLRFATTNLPQVEIFATSADTAEELWIDLYQVSSSLQG